MRSRYNQMNLPMKKYALISMAPVMLMFSPERCAANGIVRNPASRIPNDPKKDSRNLDIDYLTLRKIAHADILRRDTFVDVWVKQCQAAMMQHHEIKL